VLTCCCGWFELMSMWPGEYNIWIFADGFSSMWQSFHLPVGTGVFLTFRLPSDWWQSRAAMELHFEVAWHGRYRPYSAEKIDKNRLRRE